jgi:cyanophycinase
VALLALAAPAYQYFLAGSGRDVQTSTSPGYALIGGSTDVDEFYRWIIHKSGSGDFVVIRASGDGSYDEYIYKLGKVDSVETLVIKTPEAARDPFVADKILKAEALFIAGGDQWNYVHIWNRSPVGDAIRSLIAKGVPIGGTSAGLAILGEYVFTAEKDTVTSKQALRDPFDVHVTVGTNFLCIPVLRHTITDSHFKARDRMGRSLVFLARMLHDYKIPEARGIAVDERTAALIEKDGKLRVEGYGHVYFLRARRKAEVCEPGKPLTMRSIDVYRAAAGSTFDLSQWSGSGGSEYELSVDAGKIESGQPGGGVY